MMDVMTYDIKNEQAAYRDCQNPVQKFFKYKTANDDFDCDVSYFTMVAFLKCYPFPEYTKIEKQQTYYNYCGLKYELHLPNCPFVYRGDTCNSFQRLYQRAVLMLLSKNDYDDICNRYDDAKKYYLRDLLAAHDGLSKDFAEKLPLNIGGLFNVFAEINHTLPNMFPIPSGLNSARYDATFDNISLFLYAVYKYLHDKDESLIKAIYNTVFVKIEEWRERQKKGSYRPKCQDDVDKTFALAKRYLDSFGEWQKYVEMNRLESYVDKNYVPREYIKGQFERFIKMVKRPDFASLESQDIESCTCPQNADEYVEYLTNVISIIKSRGVQLAEIYEKA